MLEQDVEEGFKDDGRSVLVCVGERGAGNAFEAQFTPSAVQDAQICLNFPQAFLPRDLGVEQGGELIEAGEPLHVFVSLMLSNKGLKLLFGQECEELVEDRGRVGVHQKGGE